MDEGEPDLDTLREAMYREVEQNDEESRYWINEFRNAVEGGRDPTEVMRERIEHERRSYDGRRAKLELPATGTA